MNLLSKYLYMKLNMELNGSKAHGMRGKELIQIPTMISGDFNKNLQRQLRALTPPLIYNKKLFLSKNSLNLLCKVVWLIKKKIKSSLL